jgi:hypothetical protein
MSITTTPGYSWASGNTVTPARLNLAISALEIACATAKILGRSTAGTGAIEEIDCTAAGRALLDDADASAQRTTLGLAIGTDVQAYDTDLAAIAALTTTAYGRSLLEAANAAAGRTLLGLVIGTDVQAYDGDLAAIAALTTTAYGRSLLEAANAAAGRTLLGLGTAAVAATGDFDAAGAASTAQAAAVATAASDATTKANAAQAASQPLDADLTALAALSTTAYGRALLELADAAAGRTALGLLGSNLENEVTGGLQAGSSGTDLVYTSGPTIDITAGTWLVWGSASCRTNDSAGEFWLGIRNTTDGADFGKGAGMKNSDLALIYQLSAFGYITVTGTKTLRLKAFINGAHTLELGNTAGIGGSIRAVRLNT